MRQISVEDWVRDPRAALKIAEECGGIELIRKDGTSAGYVSIPREEIDDVAKLTAELAAARAEGKEFRQLFLVANDKVNEFADALVEARAQASRLSALVELAAAFVKANEDFMAASSEWDSNMADVNRLLEIRAPAYHALRAALAAGSSAKGET